jgi:glycosidase
MKPSPYKLPQLKEIIGRWQQAMYEGNGWNSIYFGNHDVRSSTDSSSARLISSGAVTASAACQSICQRRSRIQNQECKAAGPESTDSGEYSRSGIRFSSPSRADAVCSCQSGTPYVYQGEDIGMCNMPKDWGFEEYKDVATLQWVDG